MMFSCIIASGNGKIFTIIIWQSIYTAKGGGDREPMNEWERARDRGTVLKRNRLMENEWKRKNMSKGERERERGGASDVQKKHSM